MPKYTIKKQHVSYDSTRYIKRLLADGWECVRITGSHWHFHHPIKKGIVTVPHPRKELKRKTRQSILKQAGLD
ncbi:type II toxin-antitoxin system HicA family toxin [Priestia megaterium]